MRFYPTLSADNLTLAELKPMVGENPIEIGHSKTYSVNPKLKTKTYLRTKESI
jgi:hypothetical protein